MPTSAVSGHIPVLRASGTGRTGLAAFHAALMSMGLGYFNLVRLSSVIPPGTGVDATGAAEIPSGEWGDRMFCVYAEQRAAVVGEQAWAGIGWAQRLDGRGGLFVEHEGQCEESVALAIRTSLADLVASEAAAYAEPEWVLNGTVCTGLPVCSLVVAPYETTPWAGGR